MGIQKHTIYNILYYKGEIVKEYIKIAYPNHKLKFVNVKKFFRKKTRASTHTIQCSLKYLNSSFFFIIMIQLLLIKIFIKMLILTQFF